MLDNSTLLLVLTVFTAVTTLLLSAASLSSDAFAEQRLWALGSVFTGLGFALASMTTLPAVVHAGFSYGLIGTGLALALRGLRMFFDQVFSWNWVAAIALGAFALPAYFAVIDPDKAMRVLLSGLFLGAVIWTCAYTVVRGLRGHNRSAMLATAGGFTVVGTVMVARAVYLLLAPDAVAPHVVEAIAAVSLLAASVAQVSVSFGLIMMVSYRHSEKLSRLTLMDGLTGTLNRVGMERMGERVLMRARQGQRSVSVVMVDADFFKAINDTYGHPAGDQVLIHLATLLETQVRPGDLVIRYGGEEFVLILDGSGRDAASAAAERLRKIIEDDHVSTPSGTIRYQVSVGVSCSDQSGYALDDLVHKADAALYRAKQDGRNRVCVG